MNLKRENFILANSFENQWIVDLLWYANFLSLAKQ